MNKYIQPQIRAIKLAIGALERERRRNYSVGNAAYCSGIRADVLQGEITGTMFQWVEADHKKYQEYTDAIRQLEDMIEILEDGHVERIPICLAGEDETAGTKRGAVQSAGARENEFLPG
jgi:hypothetical protein